MGLLDLPDELLIKVFSFLELKDLRNAKLVSRYFYNIIENNHSLMNGIRPSVLSINAYRDDLGIEKYMIFFDYFTCDNNGKYYPKKFCRINITSNEASNYFKWLRWNVLKSLEIKASNVNGVFNFLNSYLANKCTSIEWLYLDLNKCSVVESFIEFTKYMKSVENVEIRNLCF